ncbi:MAG: hypothetical protein ACM3S2_06035 [Ignavibacteriales bacterium]
MNPKLVITLIFAVMLILTYFLKQYIFNIYEVGFNLSPKVLYADNRSTAKIEAIPLNAFGIRAPFRTISASFEVIEGKGLIEIISNDNSNGTLLFKAGNTPGKVVVQIKSEFSLMPMLVEIQILSTLA